MLLCKNYKVCLNFQKLITRKIVESHIPRPVTSGPIMHVNQFYKPNWRCISCRQSDESAQHSSYAATPSSPMFTSCFALPARYLLAYIVRVQKTRQQLASATHVHMSVNGSGLPQQFGTEMTWKLIWTKWL